VIAEGAPAPAFTLPDQDGRPTSLSDFAGRPLVLYFYPRAGTPGCTTQACGIRDRRAEYDAAGAAVAGVSPDPVRALRRFGEKERLGFTLLSDEDHAVAERYGVWTEKTRDGRTYMGVQRATFLVDPAGTVARVFPTVSPKTHDDVVLEALAAMA
jgi:thioredoxin-dependent peroxiredoxin